MKVFYTYFLVFSKMLTNPELFFEFLTKNSKFKCIKFWQFKWFDSSPIEPFNLGSRGSRLISGVVSVWRPSIWAAARRSRSLSTVSSDGLLYGVIHFIFSFILEVAKRNGRTRFFTRSTSSLTCARIFLIFTIGFPEPYMFARNFRSFSWLRRSKQRFLRRIGNRDKPTLRLKASHIFERKRTQRSGQSNFQTTTATKTEQSKPNVCDESWK